VYNAIVRNNIFLGDYSPHLYTAGSLVQNNLSDRNGFFLPPDTAQNIDGLNRNDIFSFTGATDEQYQLLIGGPNPNPALGFGYYNGEDCGVFDVPDVAMFDQYLPFSIGCLPPIPIIYEFNATQNGGNLDVEMSVKSKN
jgi:hypothetical protein